MRFLAGQAPGRHAAPGDVLAAAAAAVARVSEHRGCCASLASVGARESALLGVGSIEESLSNDASRDNISREVWLRRGTASSQRFIMSR